MSRKVLIVVLTVLVPVLAAAILFANAGGIIAGIAERQIEKTLPGSDVSITGCRFAPARSISFSGVKIKNGKIYDIRLEDLKIEYSISSLLKREISAVRLSGSSFSLDLRKSKPEEVFAGVTAGGKGAFIVREVSLKDVAIKLKAPDVSVRAIVSVIFFPAEGRFGGIDVYLKTLDAKGFSVKEAKASGILSGPGAEVSVGEIKYNNAVVTGSSGLLKEDGDGFSLEISSAELFGGKVTGSVGIKRFPEEDFSAILNFAGLDLGAFVKDFKLGEKVDMIGKMNGQISLSGSTAGIKDVSGQFLADAAGGILVIKDTSFLENMAKASKQPVDILVENFRNYRYNVGTMKIGLDGKDLGLDIALDGDAGKRVFNVILHDLFMK